MQTTLERTPDPIGPTIDPAIDADARGGDPEAPPLGWPDAAFAAPAPSVPVCAPAPAPVPPSAPPSPSSASSAPRARVEAALAHALADVRLRNAPQMSAFLRHVVERTLDGEGDRVKAYTIGVEALGKPAGFDPQTDPSVRVLAKRVRDALDDHNARAGGGGDGGAGDVRIVLRPGSYRPRFEAGPGGPPEGIERRRPACPVLHVSSVGADRDERRLEIALGGMLSRLGTVEVRRGDAAPSTRADDRVLCLSLCRVGDVARLDIDLSDARDGTVLRADVLEFAARPDDALGGGAFEALREWVAAALADPSRPIGTVADDADEARRRAALAFGRAG